MQTNSVYLGHTVFSELKKCVFSDTNTSGLFILTDEHTHKHCLPTLLKNVTLFKNATIIKIKSGEQNKTIESCKRVWEAFIKNKADRKSLLINLGGGVVGDLGGFSASAFMRGMPFINVPTTLLAMADASVGGKVGVNFDHYKNHIGFFNQAKAVFIFPGFLKTLSEKELLSGFSEMMKHALIADKKYWKEIRKVDLKKMEKHISSSISIKNKIVKKDPTEKGERKKLNFGHTIGHAIESYSLRNDKVKLLHGEAIAIGVVCESYLSFKKNKLNKSELDEISSFILSKYNHYEISTAAEKEIVLLMQHDKKNVTPLRLFSKGKEIQKMDNSPIKINFTLLRGIGNAEIDNYCDIKLIKESLNYYNLANRL